MLQLVIRVLAMASGKDLTLSSTALDASASGIYLGGTAAANLLDDYEEGTWTPNCMEEQLQVLLLQTPSTQVIYIKVGRMVTIYGN